MWRFCVSAGFELGETAMAFSIYWNGIRKTGFSPEPYGVFNYPVSKRLEVGTSCPFMRIGTYI